MDLTEEMKAAVSLAVQEAIKAVTGSSDPDLVQQKETIDMLPENHNKSFEKMEKLLYMYPTLKRLLEQKAEYIPDEIRKKSGSLVFAGSRTNNIKNEMEKLEDLQELRVRSYNKTAAEVAEIESVLEVFKDRKEYKVVQLYYFGCKPDGTKWEYSDRPTWEDIAFELNIAEKTARRWRSRIVSEMAICIFGME